MQVKNVTVCYGKNKILDDISFSIKEGKITTLIGGNGCGKTTLFNSMTKNLKLNSGEILFQGQNINKIKLRDFAKKIAIVHQYNTMPYDITVEKVVSFGRIPYGNHYGSHSKAEREENERKIQWAMQITDVLKFKDREIGGLSGGQKQRVWIAMALAQDTKYLFLDEPTTYLDIKYQIEILRLVRKLNREFGITIIMVLHDINQAMLFSDEIIGMKGGKVIIQGNPKDVIDKEIINKIYGIEVDVEEINGKKILVFNE